MAGNVCIADNDRVADAIDMGDLPPYAISRPVVPPVGVVRMASLRPARIRGPPHELGRREPGYRASATLVTGDDRLNVIDTLIDAQAAT